MKKYLILLCLAFFVQASFAAKPSQIAEQCNEYGSYQNPEGDWVTCEYEVYEEQYEHEEASYEEAGSSDDYQDTYQEEQDQDPGEA